MRKNKFRMNYFLILTALSLVGLVSLSSNVSVYGQTVELNHQWTQEDMEGIMRITPTDGVCGATDCY